MFKEIRYARAARNSRQISVLFPNPVCIQNEVPRKEKGSLAGRRRTPKENQLFSTHSNSALPPLYTRYKKSVVMMQVFFMHVKKLDYFHLFPRERKKLPANVFDAICGVRTGADLFSPFRRQK